MPTKAYNVPGTKRVAFYDPVLSPTFLSGLWKDCPLLEYLHDPHIGTLLDERWNGYNAAATTGDYVGTQATTGTAAMSTAAPGVLEIDCNSTTQGQGFQIQRAKSPFVPAAGKDIWAEFRFKIVDTFDKCQLFCGLAEIDTSIIASGALSTANQIGWTCLTGQAGVLTFNSEKASAEATSAAATLAEDTYIRLGFKVTGVTSIQQYINGVAVGTPHATANIPVVAVYPSFVCQTDDTNDPIMHLSAYRIFQLKA